MIRFMKDSPCSLNQVCLLKLKTSNRSKSPCSCAMASSSGCRKATFQECAGFTPVISPKQDAVLWGLLGTGSLRTSKNTVPHPT
ncbi:MAG: hypothetical protein EBX52_04010 [Proteobacteria bacterium]|nr:hypothetical protein [Pseudomonadota bacterium]